MPGTDFTDYVADPLNLLTVGQSLLVDWWTSAGMIVPNLAPRYHEFGDPAEFYLTYNAFGPGHSSVWSPGNPHTIPVDQWIPVTKGASYTMGASVTPTAPVWSVFVEAHMYDETAQTELGTGGPTVWAFMGVGNTSPGTRAATTFTAPTALECPGTLRMAMRINAKNCVVSDPGCFAGTHDYGPRPPRLPAPPRGELAPVPLPPVVPEWTYYVVQVTTGTILGDLPLVGFNGDVSLTTGSFSASIPLGSMSSDMQRLALEWSTPGKYSIAAVRNGRIVGEWIIWQRTRSTATGLVKVAGSEFVSLLSHRVTQPATWVSVDQITVATDLVTTGFAGSPTIGGAVAVVVDDNPLSAEPAISRTYALGDGDVASKVKELGDALSGFDLTVVPRLMVAGGVSYVERVVKLLSPRAGVDRDLVFEAGGPDAPPGSVLSVVTDEDATKLVSAVTVLGKRYTGHYESGALIDDGFPFTDATSQFSLEPEDQTLVDDYAQSSWALAQTSVLPQNIVVLADSGPLLGEYELGDVVTLTVDPSPMYPDGYTAQVRILSYAVSPSDAGPDTVALTIVLDAA